MKKMMILKIAGCVFLMATATTCFAQKNLVKSVWVTQPPVIDGNHYHWNYPFKNTDETMQLNYSIANDSANIYICIYTAEQSVQNKITITGLRLWVDCTGKKTQTTGLLFPAPEAQNGLYTPRMRVTKKSSLTNMLFSSKCYILLKPSTCRV